MEADDQRTARKLRLAQALSGLAWTFVFAIVAVLIWQAIAWVVGGIEGAPGWLEQVVPLLIGAAAAGSLLPRPAGTAAWSGIGVLLSNAAGKRLAAGLALGAGAALAVVAIQLTLLWASFEAAGDSDPDWLFGGAPPLLAAPLVLALGAAGEELLIRGYGFQQLARAATPWGAALLTGVLFAFLHRNNPDASDLAVLNTFLFGALFGVALARTRCWWVPFGMHFGWNFALAAVGAKISGLTIRLAGYEVVPFGPERWTGGAYGPEASLLTTFAVLVLGLLLWLLPLRSNDSRSLIWESGRHHLKEG